MRQAEKERKKFYSRIPFLLNPGKKIPKKIAKKLKNSFQHYFQPKWDGISRKSEKKKFSPEFRSYSIPARNFRKKLKKNVKKLKNLFPALYLAKTGIDSPDFRSYSTRGRKFRKKQQKTSKNSKMSFRNYFQPKRDDIGQERQKKKKKKKKKFSNSVHSRPGQENSEKNSKKIKKN